MIAAKAPPTPEIIADAQGALDMAMLWASGDRALKVDDDSGTHFERDELMRITNAAIAEYLRQNPRARCKGYPWVQIVTKDETDFLCLFCRTSLNTLSSKGGSPPNAFWEKLKKHCYPCACRFLIEGSSKALGRQAQERVLPLGKLKGKKLARAATEAATYLGVARRRAPGRSGFYWNRRIVADARRIAKLRQQGIPDEQNDDLAATRRFWEMVTS